MTESERIQQIIQSEQMSAKQFCEEVGIQSSTISNIFKGRNRPSLEIMQKILNRFRLISPDWLISGVGSMYRQKNDSQMPSLFDIKPIADDAVREQGAASPTVVGTIPTVEKSDKQVLSIDKPKIKKIVIFYDDNTFQELSHLIQ